MCVRPIEITEMAEVPTLPIIKVADFLPVYQERRRTFSNQASQLGTAV